MKTLPIDIDTFGFVERERFNNTTVKYKCGRDFLYYAMHYLLPSKFNANYNNPKEIDAKRLFGPILPTSLAWSMYQFYKMPKFLKENSLRLQINGRDISSFVDFISAMLFSRISYEAGIKKIEENINIGKVAGIDVTLRFEGLEDHVMFVYGHDKDNFYVFDTLKVSKLSYEKITNDNKFIMKISRDEVKKRWKRFSRVWEVDKL